MNPTTEAAAIAPKGKPKRSKGITTPSRRGGSGRVLTDVIVDLGFVEREAMDEAIDMAHSAGSAAERVLVSTGAITEDQLSRAERVHIEATSREGRVKRVISRNRWRSSSSHSRVAKKLSHRALS